MAPSTIWHITGRGFFILLALALIATLAESQGNLILNGDLVNNNNINVGGNVINTTAGLVTVSGTGTVRLTGAPTGPAPSHSIQGGTGINFYRLDMRGSRPTALAVSTGVSIRLRVGYAGNTYTAAGTGFNIAANTLTISDVSSYLGTAALTFNGGTVVFDGAAAQSILNNAAGVTYGTLTVSGAGAKSITTGGTVTAATLSQTGGQLSVTENIDVTGTGSFADIGAISATKRLQLTAAATSGSVTAMSNSSTGTFENASATAVAITTLSANAGTIQNSNTGSIAFTNAAASNGTITNTSTGTIDFNNDLTGTGTISQTANGSIEAGGAFTQTTYSLNNGTVIYNSSVAGQNVIGTTYNNLTLNSGTKTLASLATVNGNLALDASSAFNMNDINLSLGGSLTLGSNITTGTGALTMTSTTAANVSGTGEVQGAVRRNHAFTAGQNYMFNRTDVYLGTANAASDITLRMTANTDPAAPLASANYVRRNYAVTVASSGNLEAIQLHYEAAELQGSLIADDSKIGLRAFSAGSWSKVTNPGQTRNSGGGIMTYSGLSNALPASGELGMYKVNFVTAANNANISLPAGWDENAMPSNADDAVINHTGVVTGAAAVNVATLTVNPGMSLSTNGAGLMTIATSSLVDGTLNITNTNADVAAITIGNAGILSISGGRTLTGTSLTNNSSNASTFAGNVSLASLANNGTGALSFNGNGSTITDGVTNAAGASISVGGTLSMMTSSLLSLTSNGNITVTGASGILNIGQSGIYSNLTMAGTSILTLDNATSQLNVFGNLEIGATATLNNSGEITIGE